MVEGALMYWIIHRLLKWDATRDRVQVQLIIWMASAELERLNG